MDRATIERTIEKHLRDREEVVAAWLFGSQARGTARADSDVDVAVLLRDGAPRSLADLQALDAIGAELETALQCEVDVIACNGAAPDLMHRVLRDGMLVHERDHERRIRFEVAARNEYWDLLPILDLYRKTVLRGA